MVVVVNMGDVYQLVRDAVVTRDLGQEAADWMARRLPAEAVRRSEWLRPATLADIKLDFGTATPPEIAVTSRRHVQRAVALGEPLVRFDIFDQSAEVGPVADWLAALPDEDPRLLAKLPRITWAQAVERSERWHERLGRRRSGDVSPATLAKNANAILTLEGGWHWVRLGSAEALDAEGEAMGHCVGSGGYDVLVLAAFRPDGIYSLRGPDGRPCVTVEVSHGRVRQARGPRNATPIEHSTAIGALVRALGVSLSPAVAPGVCGLAVVDGETMGLDDALSRLASGGVQSANLRGWRGLRSLPAGTQTDGELDLTDCIDLEELPHDLVVGGDLELSGCASLRKLPPGLRVGGRLSLRNCPAEELPFGLTVGGDLNLSMCGSLRKLPPRLSVGGGLDLSWCRAFKELPPGLHVGGRLSLRGCPFEELPPGLSVGGDLNLSGCSALRELPPGLFVGGSLYANGCTKLTGLPPNAFVGLDLDFTECTSLRELPDGLFVAGNLILFGCIALASLPRGLVVRGRLDLSGCSALCSLPEGMPSPRDLVLKHCKSLESLPDGLSVGELDLSGCVSMARLPQGLVVGNKLALEGCVALTELPDDLILHGSLNLVGCTSVRRLPDWAAQINGWLCLKDCTALETLPEGMKVQGALWLDGCSSLMSVPAGTRALKIIYPNHLVPIAMAA